MSASRVDELSRMANGTQLSRGNRRRSSSLLVRLYNAFAGRSKDLKRIGIQSTELIVIGLRIPTTGRLVSE